MPKLIDIARTVSQPVAVALLCLTMVTACGQGVALPPLPEVGMDGLLEDVATQFRAARAAVEAKPRDGQVNGRYGLVLATYGRDKAASAMFARARLLSPDSPRWAYYHSYVLKRLGETDEALAALDAVLEQRPAQIDSLAKRAEIFFEQARFDEAQQDVDSVLATNPKYPIAQYYAGRLHAQRKEWDDAVARFERMLIDGFDVVEVHTHLGTAYRMIGNQEQAAHHLALANSGSNLKIAGLDPIVRKFDELNVGDQPHVVKAAELYRRGDIQGAIDQLNLAHGKNPANVGVNVHLTRFHGQLENLDKALYHYEKARELDDTFPQLHSNMGFAYQHAGKFDEAVKAYRRSIENNPNRPEVHAELGFALRQTGKLEEALEYFENSLKLRPVNRDLRFIMGETLMSMRRHPDAIKTFQSALEPVDQKTVAVYRALAKAHVLSANRAAAIEALEKAKTVAEQYGNADMVTALESDIEKVRGRAAKK